MGFFADAPEPRESRGNGAAWRPPAGQYPAPALTSAIELARTDEVALAIIAILAYTTGFEFYLTARYRRHGAALRLDAEFGGLRFGLQFADGRKATNVRSVPDPAGSEQAGLTLSPTSFGGGQRHRSRWYWVWPLPPPGPVTFICEWADHGIGERSAVVDGQDILAAAARSIWLWPGNQG
jgi:hypothetical protein